MKRIAVIAAALLIAAICPGRASAADHWYSFTEIENTNITGLLINDDVNASGGKTVYADDVDASKGADERDYFEFTVDVPADGTIFGLAPRLCYGRKRGSGNSVSQEQFIALCRSRRDRIAALENGRSRQRRRICVVSVGRAGKEQCGACAYKGCSAFKRGKYRQPVNKVADVVGAFALLRLYIITDNTEFDPNTDDWAKLSGTDTSESAVTTEPPAASEPQTTTEPPEPTGTPAASVGTETAAPTGSDSSSGTAAPGSDTSSDIRGGQPR